MANPNPGPLSKWLFLITMIGAVAYIGSAFVFVIMADSDGATVQQPAAVSAAKGDSKKPTAGQPSSTEAKQTPKGVKP